MTPLKRNCHHKQKRPQTTYTATEQTIENTHDKTRPIQQKQVCNSQKHTATQTVMPQFCHSPCLTAARNFYQLPSRKTDDMLNFNLTLPCTEVASFTFFAIFEWAPIHLFVSLPCHYIQSEFNPQLHIYIYSTKKPSAYAGLCRIFNNHVPVVLKISRHSDGYELKLMIIKTFLFLCGLQQLNVLGRNSSATNGHK